METFLRNLDPKLMSISEYYCAFMKFQIVIVRLAVDSSSELFDVTIF